jgi:hypothetical protein
VRSSAETSALNNCEAQRFSAKGRSVRIGLTLADL